MAKLLQALMESEVARSQAEEKRWRAEVNAMDRARQEAERLSAEELAQLRVRETENLSPEEVAQVWEHAEWNEKHFREQQEKIREQAQTIQELQDQVDALKRRLNR